MSVAAGDTIRWHILPSYMGDAADFTPIVLVKPLMGGLQTSLSIMTDRRDYDIIIQSEDSGDYMPRIGFYYPQDKADAVTIGFPDSIQANTVVHQPVINLDQIKHDYQIKGNRHLTWYPLSIFEDGRKVFIRMSDRVTNNELPIFMALDKKGRRQMVNYRYFKPYFVIDQLFDQGELVLGTDNFQQAIYLHRV